MRDAAWRAAALLWVAGSIGAGLAWSHPSLARQLDLGSFLVSAGAALEGRDPYGRYPAVLGIGEAWQGIAPVNLNPPVSLLVVAPLTLVSPLAAAWIWYVASLLMVAAAMGILARTHPEGALATTAGAATLYALWSTLQRGQLYPLVLLLLAGAWGALLGGRGPAAGLLMGAAASLKPQLLIWPALLLVRGDRRTPVWAAASAGALTLAPLAIFGAGAFPSWTGERRALPLLYPGGMSLWSIAARAGAPSLGALASALLLGAVALWTRRTRPELRHLSAVALLAALLASPVSWLGYALLLLPVGYAFAPRLREVRVAAILLGVPPVAIAALLVDSSTAPHPVLASGTMCGAVLLWILAVIARDAPRP